MLMLQLDYQLFIEDFGKRIVYAWIITISASAVVAGLILYIIIDSDIHVNKPIQFIENKYIFIFNKW